MKSQLTSAFLLVAIAASAQYDGAVSINDSTTATFPHNGFLVAQFKTINFGAHKEVYLPEIYQEQLPIRWKQSGTWNGFEIVVNQDAANILLSITNTSLKKSIPKNTFTALEIVLDPKQSADYQNLAASLVQVIEERDQARLERDSWVNENTDLRRQMSELITVVKLIRAELALDTVIVIRFPKSAFKKP